MVRGIETEVTYHLQCEMSDIVMKNVQQADTACNCCKTFQSFKRCDRFERSTLKCASAVVNDGVASLLLHGLGEFTHNGLPRLSRMVLNG